MSIRLPGQDDEWISEWQDRLNENEAYADASEGWGVGFNGDFLFAIQPDGVYDGHPLYFYVGLEDGECTEAYPVDDPESVDAGFALRGDYEDWRALFEGDVGPIDGMMSGRFEIEGDMQKVLQYSEAAVEMTENAVEIDTEYEY